MLAFQLALLLAVKIVEQSLDRRASEPTESPDCCKCGARLGSKGRKPRQLDTLICKIKWSIRYGRCPNKCRIGQVAPTTCELGLSTRQRPVLCIAYCVLRIAYCVFRKT